MQKYAHLKTVTYLIFCLPKPARLWHVLETKQWRYVGSDLPEHVETPSTMIFRHVEFVYKKNKQSNRPQQNKNISFVRHYEAAPLREA